MPEGILCQAPSRRRGRAEQQSGVPRNARRGRPGQRSSPRLPVGGTHRLEQELLFGIAGLHYVEPATLYPLKLGRQIIKCELLFASLAASGCQEPDTGHAGATCFTVKPLSPRLAHCRRCETAVRALHRRAVALSGTVSQTQLFHRHSCIHCSAAVMVEYRAEA